MRKKKKITTGLNTSKNGGVPPLLLNTSSASSIVPPLFGHSLSVKNANSNSFAGLDDPAHQSFQVSLGIDFTFNTIKNVKKVTWKQDAPWYREITDGMCWLCYCQNQRCIAYKQLVVINKGFGVFSISREMQSIRCPCCMSGKSLEVRNCGFVNCEWAMRGVLQRNKESKIYADGRTYDSKLYTFKECDYKSIWHALDIMVKQPDTTSGKPQIRNLSPGKQDDAAKQKQKRERIDKALAKEGVPYPGAAGSGNLTDSSDDDLSSYD